MCVRCVVGAISASVTYPRVSAIRVPAVSHCSPSDGPFIIVRVSCRWRGLWRRCDSKELATPYRFTITRPSRRALELYVSSEAVRARGAWILHVVTCAGNAAALPVSECRIGWV